VRLTVLSWNLFHGRDFPPDPALFTRRSRLLRRTERGETHAQVNRDLLPEFAALLAGAEWDIALLQECPPRWAAPLAAELGGAESHRALTSRNSLGPLRAFLARRNPDLLASAEGGSNLTLVRKTPLRCGLSPNNREKPQRSGVLGGIVGRRELAIHSGRPERRAMAFTRIALAPVTPTPTLRSAVGYPQITGKSHSGAGELCVANLHATNDRPEMAAEDVLLAARTAVEWAGEAPLIFGGDLNLRPAENPEVFAELRDRFGLGTPPTGPDEIDHLLARGLKVVSSPAPWPPERREVGLDSFAPERPAGDAGLAVRLSDHAPIEASFALG
jgi:Endonuclease/Exonuclease/phosphatase family